MFIDPMLFLRFLQAVDLCVHCVGRSDRLSVCKQIALVLFRVRLTERQLTDAILCFKNFSLSGQDIRRARRYQESH